MKTLTLKHKNKAQTLNPKQKTQNEWTKIRP
jgi:hypothetical protein